VAELIVFGFKVLFWGVVVIGAVWVFQQIPSPGDGAGADPNGEGAEAVAPGIEAGSTTLVEASTTTTTEPPLDPSQVTVLVLNSTERSGLASRLTEKIAALGYQTMEPDNYATPLDDSVLRYADGFADEADELARVLSEIIVEPDPEPRSIADLVIVLGASYEE
jgi:hypothetical protein